MSQGGYTMGKLLMILIILLSLLGCSAIREKPVMIENNYTPNESSYRESQSDLDANIESINDGNDKRFSYLEQLSVSKQETFLKFIKERNLQYLDDFSPIEMVLVYLHTLSNGDRDLLYTFTYNGGLLPDQDTFRREYDEYLSNHDSEMAVHYRYYDAIEIDENTAEENKVSVVVTVGVGLMTQSLVLGLQKEDNVWKMDIYHLIDYYKKKLNEVSD